ncbi:transposase [Caulobacter sp. BP25]|uniref:transposase n=1 Tax=Caulobacter sp. BP25 TaxID=2048900 RepID=UPI001F302329|nr:transposase [Caulobacter sp. BP25]
MSKRKQIYWLSDAEWSAIKPHLPRGRSRARRGDDRRVANGIVQMLRSGTPKRCCSAEYGLVHDHPKPLQSLMT